MEIKLLKDFFMWLTILNMGMFLVSALLSILLKDFVYKIHGKMFNIDRESLNKILYGYLGIYKILIITFNLVPYLALIIIDYK